MRDEKKLRQGDPRLEFWMEPIEKQIQKDNFKNQDNSFYIDKS